MLISVWYLQSVQGQILSVAAGTNFTITAGTVFSVDSLTLTPSSNVTFNNNGITKKSTITNPANNSYISQVYLFNNVTSFSGTIQFNYTGGATLNAIPENALTLNNFNGSRWQWFSPTSRDGAANTVITDVSGSSLKELTLASLLSPLPVRWQTFTAVRQAGSILLQWSVADGQNTQSLTLQHSSDNIHWQNLHTDHFTGSGNTGTTFSYVDNYPVKGNNFYRIEAADFNEKKSYTETKLVKFTSQLSAFTILANPVSQGVLKVQVNNAAVLLLYSNDGKLLLKNKCAAGLQQIDVRNYAKGIYLLRCNNSAATILIQ